MNRFLAILGAIFCLGLIFPMAATEQGRGETDIQLAVIHAASEFLLILALLLYCGFAALHAASRVQDPGERVSWILLSLGLNVLGSLIYYLTKYQDFRSHGMGRFVPPCRDKAYFFFRLSPEELEAGQSGPRRESAESSD